MKESRLALEDGSLVDLLDRLIDTGVVADGSVLITLAGVDLIRLDLKLLLAGVETLRAPREAPGRPRHRQHGLRTPDGATRVAGPFPSYGPHGARQPPPVSRVDRPELWTWSRVPGTPARTPTPTAAWASEGSLTPARLPAAAVREAWPEGPPGPRGLPLAGEPPGGSGSEPGPGIAGLVIAVVDILRQLLERQALRRMEAGALTDDEVERLGRTLDALERQVRELSEAVGARRPAAPHPAHPPHPPDRSG